jgi:hypothetical protein
MKLNAEELEKVSTVTLEHYDQHAKEFWEGTRDHDVSQNIEALLKYIEGERRFTFLDFDCGFGNLKMLSDAREKGALSPFFPMLEKLLIGVDIMPRRY